jgi:hypothetical protein
MCREVLCVSPHSRIRLHPARPLGLTGVVRVGVDAGLRIDAMYEMRSKLFAARIATARKASRGRLRRCWLVTWLALVGCGLLGLGLLSRPNLPPLDAFTGVAVQQFVSESGGYGCVGSLGGWRWTPSLANAMASCLQIPECTAVSRQVRTVHDMSR